jgi:1-acyl-sn-glycerol-3-phosphate acyltransferase
MQEARLGELSRTGIDLLLAGGHGIASPATTARCGHTSESRGDLSAGQDGPVGLARWRPSTADGLYAGVLGAAEAILSAICRRDHHGLEHVPTNGPVVVAGNHVSVADPLVLACAVHRAGRLPRFLAASGLFDAPVLGRLMAATGHVRVRRGHPRASLALRAALDALRAGECVAIYPEGCITLDPAYKPSAARTGLVRLALASGAPVIPVAQWGTQDLIGRRGRLFPSGARPHVNVSFGPAVALPQPAEACRPTAAELRRALDAVMSAICALLPERHTGGGRACGPCPRGRTWRLEAT